jgi:hypothetical protein
LESRDKSAHELPQRTVAEPLPASALVPPSTRPASFVVVLPASFVVVVPASFDAITPASAEVASFAAIVASNTEKCVVCAETWVASTTVVGSTVNVEEPAGAVWTTIRLAVTPAGSFDGS